MDAIRLYSTLEDVICQGGALCCYREQTLNGSARAAVLTQGDTTVAVGMGIGLHEALHAAEHNALSGGEMATELDQGCYTCAINRLNPSGSDVVSCALDAHLAEGRSFQVEWQESSFQLVTEWYREGRLSKEVMRQLMAAQELSRWQHGDYVWEVMPLRNKRTGQWDCARTTSIRRPPGARTVYPREKRRVTASAPSLVGVLQLAEERIAVARQEDVLWQQQVQRWDGEGHDGSA